VWEKHIRLSWNYNSDFSVREIDDIELQSSLQENKQVPVVGFVLSTAPEQAFTP
jgi:hypothetical protein